MATSKNFNPLKIGIDAINKVFTGIDQKLLKENIRNFLINRTLRSKDYDMIRFAPYSESYNKIRMKKNLPLIPDLKATGCTCHLISYIFFIFNELFWS